MKINNRIVADMHVNASEVMTKQVVSVERETTINKVIDLMTEHKISGIPVVDDKKMIVGIVSEKDIFVFTSSMNDIPVIHTSGWLAPDTDDTDISKIYQEFEIIANTKVEDLMNSKVVYVKEKTPILEVAKKMGEKEINRVPVVNEKGELSGIIARQDITNYLKRGLETVSMIQKGLETVSMIMTKPVVSVEPETALENAIKLMAKHNIAGVPVVDNNNGLVGIVSESDIIKYTSYYGGIPAQASHIISALKASGWLPPHAEDDIYLSPKEIMTCKKVSDVMNSKVIHAKEETPILEVANTMETNGINRIPIINRNGVLTGIATRQDLVNYLAKS